jgi:hypothetical protein
MPFAKTSPLHDFGDYHFVAVADDGRAGNRGSDVERSREAAMADGFSAGLSGSTETIPSHVGPGISGLGGPLVCADRIGNLGYDGKTVTVTLEAHRNMTIGDKAVQDHVVVAHLRMPVHAMRALRASIEQIELMINPPTGDQKN